MGTVWQPTSVDAEAPTPPDRGGDGRRWASCKGREAAQQFLLGFAQLIPLTDIRIENVSVAAAGSDVVTERVDHFVDADDNVLASLPLAGTLVVRDGKVSAWRDCFDPRPLLRGRLRS